MLVDMSPLSESCPPFRYQLLCVLDNLLFITRDDIQRTAKRKYGTVSRPGESQQISTMYAVRV